MDMRRFLPIILIVFVGLFALQFLNKREGPDALREGPWNPDPRRHQPRRPGGAVALRGRRHLHRFPGRPRCPRQGARIRADDSARRHPRRRREREELRRDADQRRLQRVPGAIRREAHEQQLSRGEVDARNRLPERDGEPDDDDPHDDDADHHGNLDDRHGHHQDAEEVTPRALVGAPPRAEPQACDLHLPALRPAARVDDRPHTPLSGGRPLGAAARAHRVRAVGARRRAGCRAGPSGRRPSRGGAGGRSSLGLGDDREEHEHPARPVGMVLRVAVGGVLLHHRAEVGGELLGLLLRQPQVGAAHPGDVAP